MNVAAAAQISERSGHSARSTSKIGDVLVSARVWKMRDKLFGCMSQHE